MGPHLAGITRGVARPAAPSQLVVLAAGMTGRNGVSRPRQIAVLMRPAGDNMGKHLRDDDTLSLESTEQLEMTASVIESIVDDLWSVTGICANTDDGMDAIGMVGGYLNSLVNPSSEGGDPELILIGIRRWLREMLEQGEIAAIADPEPVTDIDSRRPFDQLDPHEQARRTGHPAGHKIRRLLGGH